MRWGLDSLIATRGVDPLFTPAGFAAFADDLLVRTVNPFLRDTMERVGRDPERKLGWDDRLFGAMRVAHAAGIVPWRFAMGTPPRSTHLILRQSQPSSCLHFGDKPHLRPTRPRPCLHLVQQGLLRFKVWQAAAFPDLTKLWAQDAIDHSA